MVHQCGRKPSGEEVSFSLRYTRIMDRLSSISKEDVAFNGSKKYYLLENIGLEGFQQDRQLFDPFDTSADPVLTVQGQTVTNT